MRIRQCVVTNVVIVIAFSMSGCGGSGPRLYKVDGTLTVKGEPISDVRVQLMPIESKNKFGLIAWGVTDANGKFYVESPGGYGAAAGSYKVVLSMESARPKSEEEAAENAADREAMIKRIEEASKKAAGRGRGQQDASKIEAMKRAAMSGDPSKMEALKRSMSLDPTQAAMNDAITGTSLPFPSEYSNVLTTPKEVDVVDRSVTIDLEL